VVSCEAFEAGFCHRAPGWWRKAVEPRKETLSKKATSTSKRSFKLRDILFGCLLSGVMMSKLADLPYQVAALLFAWLNFMQPR
jgi:hypothetical protein